jgi:uncharacterized membrane protein (DUF2068 family)
MSRQRSIRVMVIAALKVLDGLWGLASGCALLAGGGALAVVIARFIGDAPHWISNALGGVLAVVGLALIFFAALDFILAWGVWTLHRWAWWLTMIAAVLSSLGSLATLVAGNLTSIPSVAINGVIIILLLTPNVKQTFV